MTDVDAVRAAQPKVEVYVYQGAQHGFGCDERGSYSKPDYDLAQQRSWISSNIWPDASSRGRGDAAPGLA